ncbi:hypothetical protein P152DRAFT_314965 [Eremomyces bilateralis CBS 781.70]|uniref:Uncharacterized protein n=1 Tax=Eremomyces bilateralis CBS 781.70 TaxID=1392243 RepID=A0A6G1G5I3_9PEZI|nr:uncharacterized protein P152DRAFT_314965 [Eremomyces bilateralis CBS 781.70]KAF1813327.1 hypothetical protein P152DRAFT_314965 [Eremomyces bilateralis CBS 781.70]
MSGAELVIAVIALVHRTVEGLEYIRSIIKDVQNGQKTLEDLKEDVVFMHGIFLPVKEEDNFPTKNPDLLYQACEKCIPSTAFANQLHGSRALNIQGAAWDRVLDEDYNEIT